MEIELIDQLIPIVSKRLEIANSKGEINVDNPLSVAAYFLYGQLGIWQENGVGKNDIIKIMENKKSDNLFKDTLDALPIKGLSVAIIRKSPINPHGYKLPLAICVQVHPI